MGKTIAALAAGLALCLAATTAPAWAQDAGDLGALRAELDKATQLLKQQQAAIEELQKKLEALEAKGAPAAQAQAVPAPVPPPAAPPFSVAWKDHRTTFTMPNFELQFHNMLQLRFSQMEVGDPDAEDRGSFRIRRARMYFEGWAGTKDLTYLLQMEWAGNPTLLDAYLNYDLTRGQKHFMVRAGQFKVPFGRQILTSDGKLEFSDRSLACDYFTHDRDLGLMVHGQFGTEKVKDMVLWSAGIFNGNGRNKSVNDNAKYQTDARIVFSPWGNAGYGESNMEGFEKPRLSLGASYENNDARTKVGGVRSGVGYHMFGWDLSFKWKRLSAYYEQYDQRNRDALERRWDSEGYTAQLGLFALPQKLEVAVRTSRVDPNDWLFSDILRENAAAVTWYIDKHAHKLVLEYRDLQFGSVAHSDDREWRLQWQFCF